MQASLKDAHVRHEGINVRMSIKNGRLKIEPSTVLNKVSSCDNLIRKTRWSNIWLCIFEAVEDIISFRVERWKDSELLKCPGGHCLI